MAVVSINHPTSRMNKVTRPTLIIVCGCLVVMIGFGLRASFGIFLAPMSESFGWGRGIFAMAIALQNLMWGLSQPVAGVIADRFGSGRVIFVGGLLYATGLFLMADSSSPTQLYVSQGFFVGLGLSGTTFAVVLAAMARAVPEERRSWALGVGTAAGSLGQFLLVPLGQGFLNSFGWSAALLLLGIGALAIMPLSRALTGRPATATAEQSLRQAIKEASGHRGYWLLFCGFFVCGFHLAFISTHLPAYLTDRGLSATLGAWVLGTVGLFNIIGAYSFGYFGDRYSKKNLLSLLYLLRSIVLAIFIVLPLSNTSALVFGAAIGLLWLSTVPLTSGLVGQIFGARYMATLFGLVFLGHQLGSFLGVWLGGRLFDSTGSYDLVWWICIGLSLVSALLHWPIDERPISRSTTQPATQP